MRKNIPFKKKQLKLKRSTKISPSKTTFVLIYEKFNF